MAQPAIDKLSLDELKELKKSVDRAIETYEKRQRQDALAAAEAAAKNFGFSLNELMTEETTKPGKLPPKYRHPENPDLTWSGRGRQPSWLRDALRNGESLESFAI